VLEQFGGYDRVADEHIGVLVAEDNFPILNKPRYALATPPTLGHADPSARLSRLVKVLNHRLDVLGQYIHVLITTGGCYESMGLKAVRHVHMFDPMMAVFAQQQAIGRASRRCSHAQFRDKNDWTVTIHIYFVLAPSASHIQLVLDNAMTTLVALEDDVDIRQHCALVCGVRERMQHIRKRAIDEYIDDLTQSKHKPIQTSLKLLETAAVDCKAYVDNRGGDSCLHGRTNPVAPPSSGASL
jgi:hypothetical protein